MPLRCKAGAFGFSGFIALSRPALIHDIGAGTILQSWPEYHLISSLLAIGRPSERRLAYSPLTSFVFPAWIVAVTPSAGSVL